MLKLNFHQKAVYWGNPQPDGYGGFHFDDPVELTVRWEDKQVLFSLPTGEEQVSRAIVYTQVDVELGGYLALGTLDSIGANAQPVDSGIIAFIIRSFGKSPSLQANQFLRKAII